jgi:hypothetical protein
MRSTKPTDFRSISNATGGIARLAFAPMRKAGNGTGAILSGAGLTVEHVDDPTVRLEVAHPNQGLGLGSTRTSR